MHVVNGNEAIVQYLVDHGTDVNEVNRYGATPFYNACRSRNKTIIKCLLKTGASINKEKILV